MHFILPGLERVLSLPGTLAVIWAIVSQVWKPLVYKVAKTASRQIY